MTKPSDVPQDVWTKAYEAHQMILNTTIPSEAGAILRIARAIMTEREACAQAVKEFPQFISLNEEDAGRTGFLVRQTNRADLVEAIRDRSQT